MDTLILKGDEAIKLGVSLINKGEVVAFPTETVYGLGGSAFLPSVIKKIYEAKGRPSDNPLIVHVSCIEDIIPLVKEFSEKNRRVAEKFMPGPITLLFPRSDKIPDEVTSGLDTVGIRIPKLDIARTFIKACGVPLAAPSANTSTRISPTTAMHVFEDMQGKIPLIIDGGESEVGIESTVLDLTAEIPTILRPGAITAAMLLEVLDSVKTHTGEVLNSAPAPGMKYKHYAPLVKTVVAKSEESLFKEYDLSVAEGGNPVCLITDNEIANVGKRNYLSLGKTENDISKNIYKELRILEKSYDYIIIIHLGSNGICASVMNRVLKAAGGVIV